tara:strand:+ start:810 stop:1889 length:1080 start_codon:yes stop_codon:yes gene_type:complete
VSLKKKIAIIGGGIFGCTIFKNLTKKNFDVTLFEKEKDILNGATTNNLNRIHKGYHYPRDTETVNQSKLGYKLFKKNYPKAVLKNFKNYYCISNEGKISFDNYLNFCSQNNLKNKIISTKNFEVANKNIDGILEVQEDIYDWDRLRYILKSEIKKNKSGNILLNQEVKKINKIGKNYLLNLANKNLVFDFVINCSFENINNITPFKDKIEKKIFEQCFVFSFDNTKLGRIGLALLDGNFFSILPMGFNKKYSIFYDVEMSVIKKGEYLKYPKNFYDEVSKQLIRDRVKKMNRKIKKYFPKLNLRPSKFFFSPRVKLINVEKTDKRISFIKNTSENYLEVFSGKVDHAELISNEILERYF